MFLNRGNSGVSVINHANWMLGVCDEKELTLGSMTKGGVMCGLSSWLLNLVAFERQLSCEKQPHL
jgi:hypothetical protein